MICQCEKAKMLGTKSKIEDARVPGLILGQYGVPGNGWVVRMEYEKGRYYLSIDDVKVKVNFVDNGKCVTTLQRGQRKCIHYCPFCGKKLKKE